MARGEGMIRRGKEVIGRGKGVMTTLDWSLSFHSLGADTKLSYMCINKLKKKQQNIALKHFLKMASAAGILSRNFVNRALFGKTGYFMLSNVAQGSCQSSNANENVSIDMENESDSGQFLPIIKLIKREEKCPLKMFFH